MALIGKVLGEVPVLPREAFVDEEDAHSPARVDYLVAVALEGWRGVAEMVT